MSNVAHETPINAERQCPCGAEPCRPGQRNGAKCAAKANRDYRKRQADKHAPPMAADWHWPASPRAP
jgi:hypothetical protein